jgi:hypothetical protein
MMIDDVVAMVGPEDHRNHVVAEKPANLPGWPLSQTAAFFLDLPQADRDLRRTQACDRNRRENGISNKGHGQPLSPVFSATVAVRRIIATISHVEDGVHEQSDTDEQQACCDHESPAREHACECAPAFIKNPDYLGRGTRNTRLNAA